MNARIAAGSESGGHRPQAAGTVTYRLRKVQELTGLDVRRLEDLIDLPAGVRILDLTESTGRHS